MPLGTRFQMAFLICQICFPEINKLKQDLQKRLTKRKELLTS
jgi:hypothetical protein